MKLLWKQRGEESSPPTTEPAPAPSCLLPRPRGVGAERTPRPERPGRGPGTLSGRGLDVALAGMPLLGGGKLPGMLAPSEPWFCLPAEGRGWEETKPLSRSRRRRHESLGAQLLLTLDTGG